MGGKTPERLRDAMVGAQELAEHGDYQRAVDSVKSVKVAHPRNIYVLALEKQLEQLLQLSSAGRLSEDQRLDIIESLPGIVEKALDGQGAEISSGQTMFLKPLSEEAIRHKEEKTAALEWLKNQYFQHAHDYVRKGEYDNALAEIRRVYIIEPANKTAHDFEQQIIQLADLRRARPAEKVASERAPVQTAPAESPAPKRPAREKFAQPAPPPPPVQPQEIIEQVSPSGAEKKPEKSRMSNWVVAAILFTIVVIGAGAFYFLIRPKQMEKMKYRGTMAPTGGAVFSPPTTSPEQTFVLSGDRAEQVPRDTAGQPEDATTHSAQEQTETGTGIPDASEEGSSRPTELTPEARTNGPPKDGTAAGGATLLASTPATPPSSTPQQPDNTTAQEQETNPFVPVEQPAQIVKLERPRFSDLVYRAGLEGQVVVQVQLDAEGRPQTAKVISSTNELLDDGVLDAVLQSRFLPARMSTGPVASSLVIPFKFKR